MRYTFLLVGLLACATHSIAEESILVEQSDESSYNMLLAPQRADMTDGCPSIPGIMYPSMSYNVGAIPWRLEWTSANFGDLDGATIQWYRYKSRDGETKAQAVPFTGKGSNTIDECYPATDEANSWYDYFVRITKPGCPTVESGIFDVQVGQGDPCMTFKGTTFNMTSGDKKYNEGQSFTLSATTTAYGGDHQYVWYHNGEPIDTTDHSKYELKWDFNNPTLIVKNATLQDGGTYSISMQDGTECVMYTDPVRIQIGDHQCGQKPTLGAQKTGITEGESTKLAVTNAVLEEGETGEFVFMLQPEGSNPTITGTSLTNMTFTPDMAGTYNIKYIIRNPNFPSCYRESKVISIVVYACGPDPTITPDKTIMAYAQTVTCTTTGLGDFETGKVTYQKKGESTWNNTWPEGSATIYNEGEYTFKYEITNSQAPGCNRSATTIVRVYHCGWGAPQWGTWVADNQKVGATITLTPSALPSENFTFQYFYTIDGGKDTVWLADRTSPIHLDQAGKYKIEWKISHKWTDECDQTLVKNITVEPCGTKATIKTNKEVMKVGENATLTLAAIQWGETAKLTYSKDGGAAKDQTFSGTTSTFKPTEPGVYVFTYTVVPQGCDPNSASVTIEVYGCGPDATVSAAEYVKAGTSCPVTVSAVGAHETGTLTYSKDGGAAQTIADPTTWTPTAVGDYKLVWSIEHDKIDCDRSAETTVHVVDCGVPADINTDKAILKTGESATLTLSAVSDLEKGTVTYSKDGGTATELAGTTFTPAEAGVYVFTYTVSHTKIDCETTDQVTITVYDCGPDAEISTAKSTYTTTETVAITTSAVGSNETGTLTYSLDGGAPVVITNPAAWAPPSVGSYVLTWKITHQYIDCTREATKTIKVSDCGEPADIEADKTTIRLGETVTFTLSPVTEEGAVGSVTYTFNGGTPIPFTGTTFTPTELGQYVFTYVIENTTLDCQTEDHVTIGVYDCGPEATVSVSPVDIKLGDNAEITVSEVGDYETGTLTYTFNGAAPLVTTPGVWTAPAAGEYVFTWSVKHSKIDCERSSVPFTVHVYDCGVPAAIRSDKEVLKTGETATLTLSEVSDVETSTLTVAKDGGDAEPFTGTAFTPTEVGVYTFTYTVTHTKIECETTNQVTIEVYGCGPDATIETSTDTVKLLRSMTITVSEVGAHESGVLTYSLNGGAPVTIQPGEWQAEQLGTYVFTWSVTHDKIDCARSASTSVVQVVEAELVFDNENGSHLWSDVKNWWPAYNRLPNYKDSAIIRVSCNVDIADAQTGDLTFDVDGSPALTILPTGALTVNHLLIGQKEGDILVRADATGNGALVLAEGNINIPATVEFYARSKDREELKTIWQYMGYPLNNKPTIATTYPQAVMYEWTNTPNPDKGGNWQRVDSLAGKVQPFSGYCMTEDKEQTYTFSGILNDPIKTAVDIPYNDQGKYPGFAFVANSWVAPIDIARMQVSDFGAADATVYIMNTGTYFEAVLEQKNISTTGMATARGQYNAIPIHAAPYLAGALSTIPPMQGFFVHTKAATTLQLDYPNAVFNAVTHSSTVNPTRTPARRSLDDAVIPNVYRFQVSGFGEEDEIYILEANAFTNQFDNGWDGYKAQSEFSKVHMAVQSEQDELAVAAIPELDGTSFFFDGGNHKTYTMLMECSEDVDGLMLWNMTKDTYTPLVSGTTLSFKCGATPERFMIINPNAPGQSYEQASEEDDRVEKFILNDMLYIRYKGRLYDACGQRHK